MRPADDAASPALSALLGAGHELLEEHADHARTLEVADEVWTTRNGSTVTLDRGDHEIELVLDASHTLVGARVVVHAPTSEVRAGLLTHALAVLGRRRAGGPGADGATVYADDDELVVLEPARSIHVVRGASGDVTQVLAATPVSAGRRDLVERALTLADEAVVRDFLDR